MNTQSILVAENDTNAMSTLCQLLEGVGHTVHTALDQATAHRQTDLWSIDLLITDVRLSDNRSADDFSGLDLASDRQFFDVPKVIWTAYNSEALQRRIGQIPGVVQVVAKQDGPLKVLDCVESFAASRRLALRRVAGRRADELSLIDALNTIDAISAERAVAEGRYMVMFGILLIPSVAGLALIGTGRLNGSNPWVLAYGFLVLLLSTLGLIRALRERQRNAFRQWIVKKRKTLESIGKGHGNDTA